MVKFTNKYNKKFLIFLSSFSFIFSFACYSTDTNKKDELNIPELEQYATCVNTLAAQNDMSAFLWDCSTYLDRNKVNNKFPTCTKNMTNPYGKRTNPGNNGNDNVFEEEDCFTAVKNFKAGWNLGNTLDSTSFNIDNVEKNETGWILKYSQKNSEGRYMPSSWEKAWGQPVTTEKIADLIYNAGFNSIRIPITWAEHLDSDDNIDSLWMDRVKETVDYFYNKGLYVIINLHHDGGSDGWIEATQQSYTTYSDRFVKVWTQIAQTFQSYDERLLFESMNEVLDEKNDWGDTKNGCIWINSWNQLFVNTIRRTGGNNAKRNLVIMTYAGAGSEYILSRFVVPKDSVKNHLILEVHNYDPTHFTWTNVTWRPMTAVWKKQYEDDLAKQFEIYKKYSTKYNIPFIIGEYCADPKKYEDYDKK